MVGQRHLVLLTIVVLLVVDVVWLLLLIIFLVKVELLRITLVLVALGALVVRSLLGRASFLEGREEQVLRDLVRDWINKGA